MAIFSFSVQILLSLYGDTPRGVFAALPFFAGVNIDENAHEVVDGGRDTNKDEKIGHGGGSFPGGFVLLFRRK
jgi:hypothetical protein